MLAERVQNWVKPWIEQGLLQGREEGRQEGRQEGRLEGRQEGEALLLRRQLRRRFGDLPEWVEARLSDADEAQLGHWADRILDAPTLDAVFAEPV